MIPRSRKRGNRAETAIETAVVNTNRDPTITGSKSQVHVGPTPDTTRKTNTTTRFSPRLMRLVTTTDSGTTIRGNCVLRTTDSWATIDPTAVIVASWKKPNRTTLRSSRTA